MKISTDVMLLVGGVGVAAFLALQQNHQEWTLRQGNEPATVRFHVKRWWPGSRWSSTFDAPLADFQGLNMRSNGAAHFEYVQDAGSLLCDGRFVLGYGSGMFRVQANPRFVARLNELGYDRPTEDQVYEMLFNRISLDFARGLREAGIRATTGQLLNLRNHGVTLPYIEDLMDAGQKNLTVSDLTDLKIHGVSPQFVRELVSAGYSLPVARIVELKIHGVDSRYIRELSASGLQPNPMDIVELKIHGVQPEFLRDAKEAGFSFSRRELVDLKVHGVTSDYLRNLRASGIRNLTAAQIVKLKIHGID